MAPPPEYDKEPKAPDKSATNTLSEETKTAHNLVNDQPSNPDNKSASSATNAEVENNKLVETLDDGQLRALLDEAINYKCPKDREGKSNLFKELLEAVEQDEQAPEAAARGAGARASARAPPRPNRNRRALPHSNSMQDLVAALAAEPAPRRHRPAPPTTAPVSTRAIHGGSLPSGVDTSFLLSEEPTTGASYLATVRCVNPLPLSERRVSVSDSNATADIEMVTRRSKPASFPMTYTARATLEIQAPPPRAAAPPANQVPYPSGHTPPSAIPPRNDNPALTRPSKKKRNKNKDIKWEFMRPLSPIKEIKITKKAKQKTRPEKTKHQVEQERNKQEAVLGKTKQEAQQEKTKLKEEPGQAKQKADTGKTKQNAEPENTKPKAEQEKTKQKAESENTNTKAEQEKTKYKAKPETTTPYNRSSRQFNAAHLDFIRPSKILYEPNETLQWDFLRPSHKYKPNEVPQWDLIQPLNKYKPNAALPFDCISPSNKYNVNETTQGHFVHPSHFNPQAHQWDNMSPSNQYKHHAAPGWNFINSSNKYQVNEAHQLHFTQPSNKYTHNAAPQVDFISLSNKYKLNVAPQSAIMHPANKYKCNAVPQWDLISPSNKYKFKEARQSHFIIKAENTKQKDESVRIKQKIESEKTKQVVEPEKNKQKTKPEKTEQKAEPENSKQKAETEKIKQKVIAGKATLEAEPHMTEQKSEPENAKQETKLQNTKQKAEPEKNKQKSEPEKIKPKVEPGQPKREAEPDNIKQKADSENTKQEAKLGNTTQKVEPDKNKQKAEPENTKQKAVPEKIDQKAESGKAKAEAEPDKAEEKSEPEKTRQKVESKDNKQKEELENTTQKSEREKAKQKVKSEVNVAQLDSPVSPSYINKPTEKLQLDSEGSSKPYKFNAVPEWDFMSQPNIFKFNAVPQNDYMRPLCKYQGFPKPSAPIVKSLGSKNPGISTLPNKMIIESQTVSSQLQKEKKKNIPNTQNNILQNYPSVSQSPVQASKTRARNKYNHTEGNYIPPIERRPRSDYGYNDRQVEERLYSYRLSPSFGPPERLYSQKLYNPYRKGSKNKERFLRFEPLGGSWDTGNSAFLEDSANSITSQTNYATVTQNQTFSDNTELDSELLDSICLPETNKSVIVEDHANDFVSQSGFATAVTQNQTLTDNIELDVESLDTKCALETNESVIVEDSSDCNTRSEDQTLTDNFRLDSESLDKKCVRDQNESVNLDGHASRIASQSDYAGTQDRAFTGNTKLDSESSNENCVRDTNRSVLENHANISAFQSDCASAFTQDHMPTHNNKLDNILENYNLELEISQDETDHIQLKLLSALIPKTKCDIENVSDNHSKAINKKIYKEKEGNFQIQNLPVVIKELSRKYESVNITNKTDNELKRSTYNIKTDQITDEEIDIKLSTNIKNWYGTLKQYDPVHVLYGDDQVNIGRLESEEESFTPNKEDRFNWTEYYTRKETNVSFPLESACHMELSTQKTAQEIAKYNTHQEEKREKTKYVHCTLDTVNQISCGDNYEYNTYKERQNYRERVGKNISYPKLEVNPRNIRSMTIGKPFSEIFTKECVADNSKHLSETVEKTLSSDNRVKLHKDLFDSSNDGNEVALDLKEVDANKLMDISARSSAPAHDQNKYIRAVSDMIKTGIKENIVQNHEDDGNPIVDRADKGLQTDFCSSKIVEVKLIKISLRAHENISSESKTNLSSISKPSFNKVLEIELTDDANRELQEKKSFTMHLAEQYRLFQALQVSDTFQNGDQTTSTGVFGRQTHQELNDTHELVDYSVQNQQETTSFATYLAQQRRLFQALGVNDSVDSACEQSFISNLNNIEILSKDEASCLKNNTPFATYLAKQYKLYQALGVRSIENDFVGNFNNSERVQTFKDKDLEVVREDAQDKHSEKSTNVEQINFVGEYVNRYNNNKVQSAEDEVSEFVKVETQDKNVEESRNLTIKPTNSQGEYFDSFNKSEQVKSSHLENSELVTDSQDSQDKQVEESIYVPNEPTKSDDEYFDRDNIEQIHSTSDECSKVMREDVKYKHAELSRNKSDDLTNSEGGNVDSKSTEEIESVNEEDSESESENAPDKHVEYSDILSNELINFKGEYLDKIDNSEQVQSIKDIDVECVGDDDHETPAEDSSIPNETTNSSIEHIVSNNYESAISAMDEVSDIVSEDTQDKQAEESIVLSNEPTNSKYENFDSIDNSEQVQDIQGKDSECMRDNAQENHAKESASVRHETTNFGQSPLRINIEKLFAIEKETRAEVLRNVLNELSNSKGECFAKDKDSDCVRDNAQENQAEESSNVLNELYYEGEFIDTNDSEKVQTAKNEVSELLEEETQYKESRNDLKELTKNQFEYYIIESTELTKEEALRLTEMTAVECASSEKCVQETTSNNAYVILTLPENLLSNYSINRTIPLQNEHSSNKNKSKQKSVPAVASDKKKEAINKKALKALLFEHFCSESDGADCNNKELCTASRHEVDSTIPFSCISTPEVMASNTTSPTAQSAVAVDPKSLQRGSSHGAAISLCGDREESHASAPAPPPAPHRPPHRRACLCCRPMSNNTPTPRSVVTSAFNGLPLSRPNYGSTATTQQDEFKKSLDENGNSVQGYSSPLSGGAGAGAGAGAGQHKKARRKKSSKNETVIKSHQIDGYQGNKDLNEVLRFIESNAESTRAGKLRKHKDDSDDKGGKKRSTERRKDKESKIKRASSLEELSRTKLEDLTDKPGKKERRNDTAPKAERRSWGDDARDSFYYHEPEPQDADFQTVTKKRKPRRRADDSMEHTEPASGDMPRPTRPPEPRARRVSAPPSDRSNDSNDDMDSVHSLPADAPKTVTHAPVSYADIARTRHNIPDLIESCNFYSEGGEEMLQQVRPDKVDKSESAPSAVIDSDGYPALESRAPRRHAPSSGATLHKPAHTHTTTIKHHRKSERAESTTIPGESPAPAPAPDVVADRRPPVILLDPASCRAHDMDGVTFGFELNEQLLGGPTRRPRCDLVRDAIEVTAIPPSETNGTDTSEPDSPPEPLGADLGANTVPSGAESILGGGVAVMLSCAALRYIAPRPPADTTHLHQIIDYVGTAWDNVLRCGSGKVRYFNE